MRVRLLLIGWFVFFGILPLAMANDACTHVDLDWISAQAPLPPDAKIVFKQEQSGLCEVVLSIEGRLAPIYAGKDFVMAGQMYKQGQALTRETMDGLSDVAQEEQKAAKEKEALLVEKRKAFFKTRIKSLPPLCPCPLNLGIQKDQSM
ncbi:MAG: hypothetical protein HUK40_16520 [Desulfobacter sp.]|nr:hypothetical protein [Desulfobacter sp.]WDP87038.1 MAG: hypothetical protein HUN05_19490 [Desulfobacter sp.]